ncbi:MAG TPA: C13 family peptidase [Thermohalobaculum sp.]|nr:C13 family peptidase [Thermohalobaculum sp.]
MTTSVSLLAGDVLRNLWAGTRLGLALPADESSFRFGPLPLTLAWVMASLSYAAVQLTFIWPVGAVSPWGIAYLMATFCSVLIALHLAAILIGCSGQSARLQLVAISALPAAYMATLGLILGVQNGVLPLNASMAVYAAMAMPALAALRGTEFLGRSALPFGFVPVATMAGAAAFSWVFLQPLPLFETYVDAQAEEPGEAWTPVDVEGVYYAQPRLMEAELSKLRPGVEGKPELFALLAAWYPDERVFLREVEAAGTILAQQFDAAGRVVRLANSRSAPDRYPLANWRNLETALAKLAQVINPDEDVLLLYLTSHGSRKRLSAGYWEIGTDDLEAQMLQALLDSSGIGNTVVVISACESGSFVPLLSAPDRMIVSASAAEKNSFGCGDASEWTYFGRALFANALTSTRDLPRAFTMAEALVTEWENAEGFEPSQPQMVLGPAIAPVLARLAAGD